ncbi:hypothetical protein MNBD_PLANCTO02-1095 [hydrothermal vent metagenome]|uniref:Uncharacterized protein n=1 Tax=hydrothermal vent metagenome TaxID=652676 RepID=A0A3B1DA58_9ZZZZ
MFKLKPMTSFSILLTLSCFFLQPANLFSQGIIRNLPTPGKWVRYEGRYEQIEIHSQKNQANVTTEWLRHITIKCLGDEVQALYQGKTVPCQWIELKVITGKNVEGGLDAGPVGARVFRVLVPKSKVNPQVKDADGIRNAFLPIVKGYKKIGDGDVQQMKTKVLQIYPLISNLMHYRKVQDEGKTEITVMGDSIPAKKQTGEMTMESKLYKTRNKAEMWVSDTIPFGLAKWKVKIERFSKGSVAPRSEFQPVTEITVEMEVREVGDEAESEIILPGE